MGSGPATPMKSWAQPGPGPTIWAREPPLDFHKEKHYMYIRLTLGKLWEKENPKTERYMTKLNNISEDRFSNWIYNS